MARGHELVPSTPTCPLVHRHAHGSTSFLKTTLSTPGGVVHLPLSPGQTQGCFQMSYLAGHCLAYSHLGETHGLEQRSSNFHQRPPGGAPPPTHHRPVSSLLPTYG